MLGWKLLPDKLRALREEAQKTPAQMAALVGCHRNTWNNLERDQQPGAEFMWDITKALSELLGRKITVADIAEPRERARRKATASVGDEGGNVAGSAA